MYQEKVRFNEYTQDLKDDIKFLRNQVLRKDEIIFKLLAQLEYKSAIETMPTRIRHQNPSSKVNEVIPEDNPPRSNNDISNDDSNSQVNEVDSKVIIIGDSLLNGIVDDKLSKNNRIKTFKHPGCTTNDLKHDVIKSIESKPSIIICHVATNDITNNVDTTSNYQSLLQI